MCREDSTLGCKGALLVTTVARYGPPGLAMLSQLGHGRNFKNISKRRASSCCDAGFPNHSWEPGLCVQEGADLSHSANGFVTDSFETKVHSEDREATVSSYEAHAPHHPAQCQHIAGERNRCRETLLPAERNRRIDR